MRKLITITIIVLSIIQLCAQNEPWIRITPVPIESHLKDITNVPGSERIIAIGSGASLLFSDDMGENWQIIYKPTGISRFITLNAIHFVDSNIGYVVGSNATILKTTDGGNEWLDISPEGSFSITDVFFLSESIGIITRDESIWKTINGGVSWDSVVVAGTINNPGHLHFINDSIGFLANSWGPGYFKTIDQGDSWQSLGVNSIVENFNLTAIRYLNQETGFVSGDDYANYDHYILKTVDGGLSWNIVNYDYFIASHNLYFYNDTLGFSVGQQFYGNTILRTNNGGESWNETIQNGSIYNINKLTFSDSGEGLYVGDRGFMLKSYDWGLSWEKLNERKVTAGSINVSNVIGDSIILIGTTGYGGGIPSGEVYRSSDRGVSWTSIFGGSPVIDLQFLNPSLGYVICSDLNSEINITTDGGLSWNDYTIDPSWGFETTCVYFLNENIGFVGGLDNEAQIYKTIDGGINWYTTIEHPQMWYEIKDIVLITDSIGYAIGPVDPYITLLRTYDQGDSWIRDSLGYVAAINKIEFINDSTGFIVGYPNTILKTVDYGVNWYEVPSGIESVIEFNDIFFPSQQTGYITGSRNEKTIIKTIDGGETWFPIDFPCTATTTCIGFFNDDEGLVMGNGGIIFKTYSGGIVDVPEFPADLTEKRDIICFPNPANEVININLELEDNNYPDLVVLYDISGIKIKSISVQETKDKINVDISAFKNGVYLIAAYKDGKIVETGKFIVLK